MSESSAARSDREPADRSSRPLVLVVDDEPAVGTLLSLLLEQFRCAALVTTSGRDAIARYRERGRDVALVFLDVRMPGLDGVQTLQALREFDPGVACCFISGDYGGYTVAELLEAGAARVLRKPFTMDQVGEVLRQTVFARPDDRRTVPREAGQPVPVLVYPEPAETRPVPGVVTDRSANGLGLTVARELPAGTVVRVCLPDVPADRHCLDLEVKHCRPRHHDWRAGGSFTHVPAPETLSLFGGGSAIG